MMVDISITIATVKSVHGRVSYKYAGLHSNESPSGPRTKLAAVVPAEYELTCGYKDRLTNDSR